MAEQVYWGIHIGAGGDFMAREQSYIGIGWREVGDLRKLAPTRDAFKAAVAQLLPDKPQGYIINAGSQLFRFIHEMKVGEWVVYRSKIDRQFYVGRVAEDYDFRPDLSAEYANVRKVKWEGTVAPTGVSAGARNEHGSALTLYQIKNYGEEFVLAVQGKNVLSDEQDEEETATVAAGAVQSTEDFILGELDKHLKGPPFEEFLKDLLRTMGYRTDGGGKPGTDGGIDITAYRDELRLMPPIIRVQAKSGHGQIGRPKVQEHFGTLAQGEYGLFVALGGFHSNATDWAKSRNNLRLIDGPELVQLILDHYEELHPRYKALLPLTRVYIPQPVPDTAG
jgi:restriction system protein